MAMSNKPLIWLPFAVGGTLAALFAPALILILLLDALGLLPDAALSYAHLRGLLATPWLRLILILLILPMLWHAAHRLRMTIQDLGARSDGARALNARLCYLGAALLSLALIAFTLRLA